MKYPLELRFKKVTLTNEMRVIDADGQSIAYVKQKLFKFKEEIIVFKDQTKQETLFTIKADRVIDWSPVYKIYDASHTPVASFKREGARSLINSTYHLYNGDEEIGTLKEQNPWIKLLDALLNSVPIVEIFSGYVINPKYDLKAPDGSIIATLTKKPALFEGFYTIDGVGIAALDDQKQLHTTILIMVIAMLERYRG